MDPDDVCCLPRRPTENIGEATSPNVQQIRDKTNDPASSHTFFSAVRSTQSHGGLNQAASKSALREVRRPPYLATTQQPCIMMYHIVSSCYCRMMRVATFSSSQPDKTRHATLFFLYNTVRTMHRHPSFDERGIRRLQPTHDISQIGITSPPMLTDTNQIYSIIGTYRTMPWPRLCALCNQERRRATFTVNKNMRSSRDLDLAPISPS